MRTYDELHRRRLDQFRRLKSAKANYSFIGTFSRGDQIVVRVRYSFDFVFERGVYTERDVEEFYILRKVGSDWLIAGNYDYQS